MGWYEAVDALRTIADRLADAELNQRLSDVRIECAKLAEENARLRQELTELRERTRGREDMQFRDNVYWRCMSADKNEGPFCPKCLDGDGKSARMMERVESDYWVCPVCKCSIRRPGRAAGPRVY